MEITTPNLNFFFTGLNNTFGAVFDATQTWHEQLATDEPSVTEQNVYGWTGMVNKMRLWDGPRQVDTVAPQTYVLVNQPFEKTLGIDKFKLKDDTYGIYYRMIQDLALQAKKWPDYQLRDLLLNQGDQTGGRQLGLDGLTHFHTAHPVDIYDASKGTYANDFKGGGITINSVLTGGAWSPVAYSTLWAEFAARKAQNGEPLGVTGDLVVVAPQLYIPGKTVLQTSFFAPQTWGGTTMVGSTENVLQQQSDLKMVEDLAADPTTWYLLCTKRAVKPFIWQLREAVETTIRNQPQDPVVFDTHTYLYGIDSRGAPGWSHAFLSARSGP